MKMSFREASIAFTLGVVASTAALSCQSRYVIKCTTGDLSASVAPEAAKSLESAEYGWIRSAASQPIKWRRCDMGEYFVVTPIERGHKVILVLRNGNTAPTLFAATADTTNLFDPDGKRGLRGLVVQLTHQATTVFNVGGKGELLTLMDESLTLADPATKRVLVSVAQPRSGAGYVSYSAYDPSQAAWVENVDAGPDGNIDFRTTEVAGRPLKTEFRVGERWLERVERDGQVGTILAGQFMSLADARRKLGVKVRIPRTK